MFTNLKLYLYIGIAVLVLGGASWAYSIWQDYQALIFEHEITLQNSQAFKDELSIIAGKETILASQVRDLAAENEDLKGKTIALQVKNKALLDSLHSEGSADSTELTDSTALVTFSGKEKFAIFKGWTLANLQDSKKSTWNLDLSFDEINTKAVIFKDTDGLWKLKTVSLTSGVRVKGTSVLDDDTFAALQKYSPPTPPKNFGLNIQSNTSDVWGGVIIRFDDRWYLNVNYQVTNSKPAWSDNMLFGISFFLF